MFFKGKTSWKRVYKKAWRVLRRKDVDTIVSKGEIVERTYHDDDFYVSYQADYNTLTIVAYDDDDSYVFEAVAHVIEPKVLIYKEGPWVKQFMRL